MNNETIRQIHVYLKNYVEQKHDHPDYIDYYEMFDMDSSMSLDEIKKNLKDKKIRKLFHLDQAAYLDKEIVDVYMESIDEVTEMNSVFANERLKKQYDEKLNSRKQSKEKPQEEKIQDEDLNWQETIILDNAIRNTIDKYGFYQGYMALQHALKNDFSLITNDNNFRTALSDIGTEKVREIVFSKRVDIMETDSNNIAMDYFSRIIEEKQYNFKRDCFSNMCMETAIKYDVKQGINQLGSAIDRFINENNPYGFTNNNGARDTFIRNEIKPKDAWILMCSSMHRKGYDKPECLFSNYSKISLTRQIDMFSTDVKVTAKNVSQFK